jgi:hypothetical protein
MSGWFLERIEIEGLRGINNEGAPLVIHFKSTAVTSVSAPNGVGKSSIFDALSFAIRGTIPKLDSLQATEKPAAYYVNRFHSVGEGHITLTLAPAGGGTSVAIKVHLSATGVRTVSGPPNVNAQATLGELDREFVLLDHTTFQSFIETKDLDRGRSFAGLLGLKQYSELRQKLQNLARTQNVNTHYGTAATAASRKAAFSKQQTAERNATMAYQALTKRQLADAASLAEASAIAHAALEQIELLKGHCSGKAFCEIDFAACTETIKAAEGGEDKAALALLIQQQQALEAVLNADTLLDEDRDALRAICTAREEALKEVGSEALHRHLETAQHVLANDAWHDKNLCPTCQTVNDASVLEKVTGSLAQYEAVKAASDRIAAFWDERGFGCLTAIEASGIVKGEPTPVADVAKVIDTGAMSADQVDAVWQQRKACQAVLESRLATIVAERATLEKKLPPSYVAVTTAVEAAKRLFESWTEAANAEAEVRGFDEESARCAKIKRFLDSASSKFAIAESNAATRRLAAVEPVCRDIFKAIVHAPVEPALVKEPGAEELTLSLSDFWGLSGLSAQALLSESFRNALAVSVYLAAAQLYGGTARFIVLDDVTSSFDAGHQYHMMEIIKTKFARPGNPNGPQLIILSHDTMLEKLFNKYGGGTDWQHWRLEGTARTAVLPQTGAINRVRDITVQLLSAGQVEEGSYRLRPYLEYKLLEIITRVKIPVPIDFAMEDTRKQMQFSLDAINGAIDLHKRANSLVLTAQQEAGLQTHMATITGNYLAHFATGSTQAFSGPALLGVVTAIDAYADCFKREDPPGSGTLVYYKSLKR